jgi:hypothetical protein
VSRCTREKEIAVSVHPREELVRLAEKKILDAVQRATESLTTAETIRVVTNTLSEVILGIVKYRIRRERHGNTDTPGGLAPDAAKERVIGEEVVPRYDPKYDKEYTDSAILNRKAGDGQAGKVIDSHNAHGLCYVVQFPDQSSASYEPEELKSII